MPHVSFRTARALAVAAAALAGSAAPAAAHDAAMPANAKHGLLPNERWVNNHWAPFDERQAERELRLKPGQLQAFLYNDHRTLAQLARQKDVPFETLVDHLAAWTDHVPGADKAEIKQRIRLVLIGGHLAQHVFYHVFHGLSFTSSLVSASTVSEPTFRRHRGERWSYRKLIAKHGGDADAMQRRLGQLIDRNQQRGVRLKVTPASEGKQLAALEQRRLPCWFDRPAQYLDPSAPYDRRYTKHDKDHTSADVPATRAEQRVEDRLISRGLAGRPPGCWDEPQPFHGDPGAPISRRELRRLGHVPAGFKGPLINHDTMVMPG